MDILEYAEDIFGEMRSLTKEERESIRDYIKSISKPVQPGQNLFDIIKEEDGKEI